MGRASVRWSLRVLLVVRATIAALLRWLPGVGRIPLLAADQVVLASLVLAKDVELVRTLGIVERIVGGLGPALIVPGSPAPEQPAQEAHRQDRPAASNAFTSRFGARSRHASVMTRSSSSRSIAASRTRIAGLPS